MKKLAPFIIACCISGNVIHAQTVDYNRIILPENITTVSFDEKLVQLAWRNNPSNRIVEENIRIAQKEKAIASWSWLDNIYAVGNLNEFTLEGTNLERQIFYPRYNFGVRLSLGTFVKTPLESKVADSRRINAEFELNARKIELRAEVLKQLERFKESLQILKLRTNLKEEYYQIYQATEDKFQLNEASLKDLQTTHENYVLQAQNVITAQSTFNQEKIGLEALLGVKLEDVEGYAEFIASL